MSKSGHSVIHRSAASAGPQYPVTSSQLGTAARGKCECQMPNAKCQMPNVECQMLLGHWSLGIGDCGVGLSRRDKMTLARRFSDASAPGLDCIAASVPKGRLTFVPAQSQYPVTSSRPQSISEVSLRHPHAIKSHRLKRVTVAHSGWNQNVDPERIGLIGRDGRPGRGSVGHAVSTPGHRSRPACPHLE